MSNIKQVAVSCDDKYFKNLYCKESETEMHR